MKCQHCFQNEAVYGGECDDCLLRYQIDYSGGMNMFEKFIVLLFVIGMLLICGAIIYGSIYL